MPHIKGVYTGAEAQRKGIIEEAKGGTLLLDEIGDLSMQSQVELLPSPSYELIPPK